jgi:hypothetical protein
MKAALAGVFLAALVIRLILVLTQDRTVWGEEPFYLWLGENFLSGFGYQHYSNIPEMAIPPGFPLFCGLLHWLFGLSFQSASDFWFVLAGTAAGLPLFLLGRRIHGETVALLAVLLYAFSPALTAGVLYGGTMVEPILIFFLLSGIYFSYRAWEDNARLDWVLASVCLTLAYLIQVESIFYYLVFLGAATLRMLIRRQSDWKASVTRLGIALGVFLLLACPYLIFLHQEVGHPTLIGKIEQKHRGVQAEEPEEQVQADIEAWGLDPRKHEVRYYSRDIVHIPLLTRFFEDPILFLSDTISRASTSIRYFVFPRFFGVILLMSAVLGIFGTPWDRKRVKRELFVILALLPLACFWPIIVLERFFYPAIPLLLLWSARGLWQAGRWIDRTAENLVRYRSERQLEEVLKTTAFFLILLGMLWTQFKICENPYPPHLRGLKWVARWVAENTPHGSIIMCRQPEIAFHADRKWVAFPHATMPDCWDYAVRHEVDFWIFESDIIRSRRPHLLPYLTGQKSHEGLVEVYRMESPPDKTYAIFKMQRYLTSLND